MEYGNVHVQRFSLPGAPEEPELAGSGIASEAKVMELEEQIEFQRRQQAELIARIAEHEQNTLDGQREILRRIDNGMEPARAYNSSGVRDSFRQHRASRRESSPSSREPSRERSIRSDSQYSARSGHTNPTQPRQSLNIEHNNSQQSLRSNPSKNARGQNTVTDENEVKRTLGSAEEELQMTEQVVNEGDHITLAQLGPLQIGLRMVGVLVIAAVIGISVHTILNRLG